MSERTIEVIDAEIARLQRSLNYRWSKDKVYRINARRALLEHERQLVLEERTVTDTHLMALTDQALADKARYYLGKIEATSDPAWVLRWQRRHVAVVKEQNSRLRDALRRTQAAQRGLSTTIEFNIDPEVFGIITGGALNGTPVTSKEDGTMKPDDSHFQVNIYNPTVVGPRPYPSLRAVLRDRHALRFEGHNVLISADEQDSQGNPKYYLEPLSADLKALGVAHRIEISGSKRRTLKVDMTTDAFKRVLATLL